MTIPSNSTFLALRDGLTDPSGLTMDEMQKGVNEVVKNTASLGSGVFEASQVAGAIIQGAS